MLVVAMAAAGDAVAAGDVVVRRSQLSMVAIIDSRELESEKKILMVEARQFMAGRASFLFAAVRMLMLPIT